MKDDKFLFALIIILGIVSFFILKPFLTYVLFAVVFVVVAYPFYSRLKSRIRSSSLSALLVIFIIIFIIIVPSAYITVKLAEQARSLFFSLGDAQLTSLQKLEEVVSSYTGLQLELTANIQSWVGDVATMSRSYVVGNILTFTKIITNFTAGILLMFFVMYYLFVDGEHMVRGLKKYIPLEKKYKNLLLSRSYTTIHALFIGSFLTAIIQGIIAALGFMIFGVPNPIFWGFVTSVVSILQFIPASIVYIPGSIFLFFNGNIPAGLGLLVYGLLIVSNIDNVVRPQFVRMYSKYSNIHSLTIVLGVIGGLSFIGLSGIVIGPLILSLFLEVVRVYAAHKRKI
ncbi:MAG: AI-2E family transporter [Candidatus Aenigmarchaeota archaeon]|nr:AI-2E family transporter [Candidatus Aenigmarchaeota archaeon]